MALYRLVRPLVRGLRSTKTTTDLRSGCRAASTPSGGSLPPDALPSLLETQPASDPVWATAVYPANSLGRQSQARRSLRPAVDPSSTSVFLFPGQGAQWVGMAESLLPFPHVAELFEEASAQLGYDLLEVCRRGPASQLDSTEVAQPALLVTALAAVERVRDEQPAAVQSCMAAAGVSVGELAALCFAGAVPLPAAVRLAQVRGQAMQLACDLTPGGMMTVLFRPDARVKLACKIAREWCADRGITPVDCRVASYLFPHCCVIAGNLEALQFIAERAAEFGLRRCTRLRVAGAFHTSLMSPAADAYAAALDAAPIAKPKIPVYSNVDGRRHGEPDKIRRQLVRQLTAPVKWEQTMHVLYERAPGVPFPRTFECGPGTTLKTILTKVNAKAADVCESVQV